MEKKIEHFSLYRLVFSSILVATFFLNTALAEERLFGSFVYPLMGPKVTSAFGTRRHPVRKVVRHHNGLDLAAESGAPIRAVEGGVVVFADPYAGYGKLIVVKHKNGLTTHYGHCESIGVKPGTTVKSGEIIGTVGETGLATGPHLHFEVRRNGNPLDPEKIFPNLREGAAG